jgi:hypothetical protein
MPCTMVGYTHDSTTFWRIWDPNFQVVRAQSEVIFDEERNSYISCTTDGIDIFGLPENAQYIEQLERVKATEVVIVATLMMSQMFIAICPTTIHFVEVSLHVQA